MFAHRLRRWTNINPALVQRIVFAGMVRLVHVSAKACVIETKRITDVRGGQKRISNSNTDERHRTPAAASCAGTWVRLARSLRAVRAKMSCIEDTTPTENRDR